MPRLSDQCTLRSQRKTANSEIANAKRMDLEHGIEHRFIRPAAGDLVTVKSDPLALIDAILADEGHGHDQSELIPPLSRPQE